MNINDIIMCIIGIFVFIMGIGWSKKNWLNFAIKILLLFSGIYIGFYMMMLTNIISFTK